MEWKCFYCGHEVIWNSDFDFEDVNGPIDGDDENKEKIVTFFTCPHCGAEYEVTHG